MDGVNDVVNNGMGDALSSILSNPELMSKISAIASSLSGGETDSVAAASASVADAHPPGNAAPSGLASVLSNPGLLSKLPEVMATLAPILSGNTEGIGENNTERKNHNERAENNASSTPTASIKTDVPGRAHRTALLCALKPYMSPRRREAIDYIIKIDRIGDLLHTLT